MLVRCLHVADKQRRVAVHGYDSRLVRAKGLLKVAGRYRLAVRVQAEEDGEYTAPMFWYMDAVRLHRQVA
jgi:hypothetical protein